MQGGERLHNNMGFWGRIWLKLEPMWMAIGALIMYIYKREILYTNCELFNLNMPYKGKAITQ